MTNDCFLLIVQLLDLTLYSQYMAWNTANIKRVNVLIFEWNILISSDVLMNMGVVMLSCSV